MNETNPLGGRNHPKCEATVRWSDPALSRVTRLRLISDPGHPEWDVSYCYGELKDGIPVRVDLPFSHLKKAASIGKQIAAYARIDGVYAKGLGIYSAISTFC